MDTNQATRGERVRNLRWRAALAVAGVLAVQACGSATTAGGGDVSPEPELTPATAEEIAALEPYFALMRDVIDADYDGPRELTEPDSPAHHYTVYLEGFDAANEQELGDDRYEYWEPFELERTDDGYELCHINDDSCTVYSDLLMRDGLLVSYSIDGVPLADQIVVPSGDAGVYESQFGRLEVTAVLTRSDGGIVVLSAFTGVPDTSYPEVAPQADQLMYRSGADVDDDDIVRCDKPHEECTIDSIGGTAEGTGYYWTAIAEISDVDLTARQGQIALPIAFPRATARVSEAAVRTESAAVRTESVAPFDVAWIDLATGAIVD